MKNKLSASQRIKMGGFLLAIVLVAGLAAMFVRRLGLSNSEVLLGALVITMIAFKIIGAVGK